MNPFSHGAIESPKDYRNIVATESGAIPPVNFKIDLAKPCTNQLCNQRKDGICTACDVRMRAEHHFNDGVRLSEYWLYLMGKVLIENALYEGSAISYMQKVANKYGIPNQLMEVAFPLEVNGTYADFIASFQTRYGGKIPQTVLESALQHVIPGYRSVPLDQVSIANEISAGRMVGFMLTVGENTYTDVNGNVTWLWSFLCPWRAPKVIDGGHAIACNEYIGLGPDMELRCPQSWSGRYCADNPHGAGYVNFIFSTQKPYLKEAWVIDDVDPAVIQVIKMLPPPAYPTWYQKFLALLKLNNVAYVNGNWVYTK